MEKKRQKQPRELYEGRRGCRKKGFFYLQTFYPFFQNFLYVYLMFIFVSQLTGQEQYATFLMADWKNEPERLGGPYSTTKDSLFSKNDGFSDTRPTENLMVLNKDEKCPTGWTEFIDQHWYGLQEGCNCNKEKEKPETWDIKKIHGRECRGVQEQTLQGCVRIESVNPQPIRIFKNKLICRKPIKFTIDYLRKQWIDPKTKKCKDDNQRLCGAFKTEYYQMCVPKDVGCPIRDFRIVEKTDEIKAYI